MQTEQDNNKTEYSVFISKTYLKHQQILDFEGLNVIAKYSFPFSHEFNNHYCIIWLSNNGQIEDSLHFCGVHHF